MRVVAGVARGRRLKPPPGTATRPTGDRVREAVFGALTSLGVVVDARVADLFAGSGALGIEALSRGATHATFVERDRRARAVVRANLEATGLADRATVRGGDAVAALGDLGPVDLVLADPPYAFDAWPALLVAAAATGAALVVAESDRPVEAPGWAVRRCRSYGTTVVTFLAPSDHG